MFSSCVVVFALLSVSLAAYTPPKKAGKDIDQCLCRLDARINATSIATWNGGEYLKQLKQYLWGTACGRSRGVFTLTNDPQYAGNTYSCAHWPPEWGINSISDWFKTPDVYAQHIKYLDMYLQGNYNTTANKVPSSCDFATWTTLECGADRFEPWRKAPWAQKIGNQPFRGVNAGGIFVLEPWITPKFTAWSLEVPDQYKFSEANPVGSPGYQTLVDHWNNWYTDADFVAMKALGLNVIRLPTGWWYWAPDAGVSPAPYTLPSQSISSPDHPITKFITMANKHGLAVILDLHGSPSSQNGLDNSGKRSDDLNPNHWGWKWFYDPTAQENTTKVLVSMAKYIDFLASSGVSNVIALELLNEPWVFGDMAVIRDWYRAAIIAIREVSQLPLIIHDAFRHSEWEWLLTNWPYENIFMDTHIYHAFNSDDIASSTPTCDKNKMIVAQNIACGYGSMLRFKTCTSLPTLVGEWSMAIDDCMGDLRGAQRSVQFQDFGQCKNLAARVNDPWWKFNYQRFAYKQMSMAERELGWIFWTWKTKDAETDPSNNYWSLSDAVKNKVIPSPLPLHNITEACFVFESTEPFTC